MRNGNNNGAMVKGSVGDIAQRRGLTVAEAFMDAKAVVVVDTSASMGIGDAGNGRSRYTAACEQLARLQTDMPGEVAVVSFSNDAVFCPSGVPIDQGGGTDMRTALEFVKKCDGLMRIVVIGDGEPDDPAGTLALARTFAAAISCLFVGQEGSPGYYFMRELAAATGGVVASQEAKNLEMLSSNIRLLLSTGGGL